jgi:hypothetical protein
MLEIPGVSGKVNIDAVHIIYGWFDPSRPSRADKAGGDAHADADGIIKRVGAGE